MPLQLTVALAPTPLANQIPPKMLSNLRTNLGQVRNSEKNKVNQFAPVNALYRVLVNCGIDTHITESKTQ